VFEMRRILPTEEIRYRFTSLTHSILKCPYQTRLSRNEFSSTQHVIATWDISIAYL
jgi:hypothetical protein